jgi:hypothetical protein
MMDDQGVVQLFQAEQLLTDSVRAMIFSERLGAAHAAIAAGL